MTESAPPAPTPDPRAMLVRADSMLGKSPVAALAILERIIEDESISVEVRAESYALIAQHLASGRSEGAMFDARHYLARAAALGAQGVLPRGRHALAVGYLAFREARDTEAIKSLEEAISLLEGYPRLLSRAYDVLGMLLSRRSDLDGAHNALIRAVEMKRATASGGEGVSLALTYGNLGRLELSRGRFRDAEEWLRHDLQIILQYDPRPATEAHVRNQLAQAIAGQGVERRPDAQIELDRARSLAPKGSVTQLYVLKNVAMLLVEQKQIELLRREMEELRTLTREHRFPEFDPWMLLLEGHEQSLEGTRSSLRTASAKFEAAWKGFLAREMPFDACEAALDWADTLTTRAQHHHALTVLTEVRRVMESLPHSQRGAIDLLENRFKAVDKRARNNTLLSRARRKVEGQLDRVFARGAGRGAANQSAKLSTFCLIELRGLENIWSRDLPAAVLTTRANKPMQAVVGAMTEFDARLEGLMGTRAIVRFAGGTSAGRAVQALKRAQARLNELRADLHGELPRLHLAAAIAISWSTSESFGNGVKALVGPGMTEICSHIEHAGEGVVVFGEQVKEKLPVDLARAASAIQAEGKPVSRYRLLISG